MRTFSWLCGLAVAAGIAFNAAAADAPNPASAPDKKVDISKLFDDEVIAKGTGFEIKRSQLDDTIASLSASLAAGGQSLPPVDRSELESTILDRMIMTQLLLNRGTADEKKKATEQAEDFIKKFKATLGSEEAFTRRVQAVGMTVETFKTRAFEDALKQLVVDRELGSKIIISDEAVKKFYDANPKMFETPESVRLMHILILSIDSTTGEDLSDERKKEKRAQIDKLLVRARAGEDFLKLVNEFSEDKNAKGAAAEYVLPRGQVDNRFIEVENAAFVLEPKQISDIVVTRFGYYIIKSLEKSPARKKALTEVAEKVKEHLLGEEVRKQLPELYEKLKKEASVKITLKGK